MNLKPKVWHLIFTLCIILIVFRFTNFIDLISLGAAYFTLIVTNFNKAKEQLSLEFIDYFLAGMLLIFIPVYLVIRGRKRKIFKTHLDFALTILTILFFVFLFAPLISNSHPDFQKNIGVTKLLPPLTKVMSIQNEKQHADSKTQFDKFLARKKLVIKSSYDENLIFIDSVQRGEQIYYFQNGKRFGFPGGNINNMGAPPLVGEKTFLLGTDEFGRDIFSRLIYGARISIFVGFGSVLVSFFIGLLLGFTAGYFSGIVDLILNRLTDTFLSFPAIFLIIIILALFGSSIFSVIIVLGFSGWMSLFKIVRGEVISLKQKDFFISAKLIGLSLKQLLIREILPVLLTPIIVNLVFQFGNVILAEAALSYLGLGTGGNHPSWGSMIEAGQNYLKDAWWMILFPGAALIITLYSANDLGQKIKTHFNPQLQK